MQTRKLLILPLFLILLSSGVVPYSFASVESEAQEDIQAGCRDGQTLVHRSSYKDYVCVEPSTANRWVELGLAEIVNENPSDPVQETPKIEIIEIPKLSSPPIPQRSTFTSDDSPCRDGQSLVFRFVHHDTFCTSSSTAASWERLGLAEIIQTTQLEDKGIEDKGIEDKGIEDSEYDVNSSNEINVISKSPDEELVPEISTGNVYRQATEPTNWSNGELWVDTNNGGIWVNVLGITTSLVPDVMDSQDQDNIPELDAPVLSEPSDSLYSPGVHYVGNEIWLAVDPNYKKSVLIEGEDGIVVIDSSSSYNSSKQIIDDFKSSIENPNKPVKVVIFTIVNPDLFDASKALMDENEDVLIVLHEDLLNEYVDIYNSTIPNPFTFSSKFEITVSGVPKMNLVYNEGDASDQTVIYLPENKSVLIGDNKIGLSHFVIDSDLIQNLFDEEIPLKTKNN